MDVYFGMKGYLASIEDLEMAQKFGKRIEGRDGDYLVVGYHFNNRIYITDAGIRPLSEIEDQARKERCDGVS